MNEEGGEEERRLSPTDSVGSSERRRVSSERRKESSDVRVAALEDVRRVSDPVVTVVARRISIRISSDDKATNSSCKSERLTSRDEKSHNLNAEEPTKEDICVDE